LAEGRRQERDFLPRRPAPQNGLMRRQEQRDSKLRAKKPATGGTSSQVSTKGGIARLGGGCHRDRTCDPYHVNKANPAEIADFIGNSGTKNGIDGRDVA
jgi:hypothetical protein